MMDLKQFRHSTQLRVRSYEVDWQGIVHNANYLRYFEVGRIEYLKAIGASIDVETVMGSSKVVLVRHEIDYRDAARFDDRLTIFTRTAWIRNSSFAMEGIIEDETTGRRIAETVAVHVWLDPDTDRPQPVPEHFRERIRSFEGTNAEILLVKPGETTP
jgi:acyl-CoA thioester hydrolase